MSFPKNYTHLEYDTLDSTNIEARRLINNGEISGNVVISAKNQNAGKGRLGRSWLSYEGNLFASIVCDSTKWMVDEEGASLLPFLSALAVGDTLQEFIKDKPIQYKWPNDVLIDGKKASGILIEIIDDYIITGIGINIVKCPDSGTKFPATFLNNNTQSAVTAKEVLQSLIHNFDKRANEHEENILRDWTAKSYGINKNITIIQENKEISGVYRGIDENGWLILETDGSKRELVTYGDVIF